MVVTSDYDYLVALSRKLSEDNALFALVDGKFKIDFPAGDIARTLSSTTDNRTLISVSLPNVMTKAAMGYDSNGLVYASAMFQIDVASLKGNNSEYCRRVANAVKVLIEGDIVQTVGSQYVIYIDRINDNTFYDEAIAAWHSALIVYGEYRKSSK